MGRDGQSQRETGKDGDRQKDRRRETTDRERRRKTHTDWAGWGGGRETNRTTNRER